MSAAAATRPALAVDGLAAGYGGVAVVRDINVQVSSGEVVVILGPNGAGKTTTLDTIAGLNTTLEGSVKFEGEDLGTTPAHVRSKQGLALVPEGRALFFGLTVAEHLKLAGGRNGSDRGELFEMLPELKKCWNRKAGVLSGGEQQMLAIGRALISRPKLLLVDELSMGLAPVIVERLLPILRRAADDLGCAVLFVEQHVALALEVSDRAYVLTHGRIVLEGASEELRQNRELLTASYLGDPAVANEMESTTRRGAV